MKILIVYDSQYGNTEKIARPIADKLVEKGGRLIFPPEGFYVSGTEGPLKDGELERAAEWGKNCWQYNHHIIKRKELSVP
jgi:hypothetical protein